MVASLHLECEFWILDSILIRDWHLQTNNIDDNSYVSRRMWGISWNKHKQQAYLAKTQVTVPLIKQDTIGHATLADGVSPAIDLVIARYHNFKVLLSTLNSNNLHNIWGTLRGSGCPRCSHAQSSKVYPEPGFTGWCHFCITLATPKTNRGLESPNLKLGCKGPLGFALHLSLAVGSPEQLGCKGPLDFALLQSLAAGLTDAKALNKFTNSQTTWQTLGWGCDLFLYPDPSYLFISWLKCIFTGRHGKCTKPSLTNQIADYWPWEGIQDSWENASLFTCVGNVVNYPSVGKQWTLLFWIVTHVPLDQRKNYIEGVDDEHLLLPQSNLLLHEISVVHNISLP